MSSSPIGNEFRNAHLLMTITDHLSRDQSFDHHVKLFEHFLNLCLDSPRQQYETAWNNLKTYSLLSSIQKVHRRFRNCKSIESLRTVPIPIRGTLPSLPGLTKVDETNILMVLILNPNGRAMNSTLFEMVTNQRPTGTGLRLANDPDQLLSMFHAFVNWLISEVRKVISHLNKLRAAPTRPESLPVKDISTLLSNLNVLRYFSWKSEFFVGYITAMLDTGVNPVDMGKSAGHGEGVQEFPEGEGELDIATEFDTEESPTTSPSNVHRCISELRLITSNLQHIVHLQDIGPSLKRQPIRFQILKYPRSDDSLKPWREVIGSLFSPYTTGLVLQALRDASATNKKYNVFQPNGPKLTFKGQAHCEAVLGCLYALANGGGGDVSWVCFLLPVSQILSLIFNPDQHLS